MASRTAHRRRQGDCITASVQTNQWQLPGGNYAFIGAVASTNDYRFPFLKQLVTDILVPSSTTGRIDTNTFGVFCWKCAIFLFIPGIGVSRDTGSFTV